MSAAGLTRRRMIRILGATALVASGVAHAAPKEVQRWRGVAMGADVSLDLHGATPEDLAAAVALIRGLEATFSLYDPRSELTQLNTLGGGALSSDMAALLSLCHEMHDATGGLFDPTIQPVFAALLRGETPPWDRVGWSKLRLDADHLMLGEGQALTLNGIAQGYATDRVRDLLRDRGLTHALVSVGEQAALGGPFTLQLEDPTHGALGRRTLHDGAVATSSPGAMLLPGHAHILHPKAQAHWSTVSVEGTSATLADAVSTALCLASEATVREVASQLSLRVTLVDHSGDLVRIG